MTLTRRERGMIGVAALATVVAVAHAELHHSPARAAPPTPTTLRAPARDPRPRNPVVLRVDPSTFAARVRAAAATLHCPAPARALAWAEIDADGTLLGIHAACATTGAP